MKYTVKIRVRAGIPVVFEIEADSREQAEEIASNHHQVLALGGRVDIEEVLIRC